MSDWGTRLSGPYDVAHDTHTYRRGQPARIRTRTRREGARQEQMGGRRRGRVCTRRMPLFYAITHTADPTQSDWDESSAEEEEEETKPTPVAPPKKKGTLKAKLAEIEAAKAARAARGEDDDDDDEYDEDAVLDPREKARRDKEREISADLENAASLLGAASVGGERCRTATVLPFSDDPMRVRGVVKGPRCAPFGESAHQGGFPGLICPNHRPRHQTTSGQAPLPFLCGISRPTTGRPSQGCRSP